MSIYRTDDLKFTESIFAPFLAIAIGLVLCTSIFVGFLQYWQNSKTNIDREDERLNFAAQHAVRNLKAISADTKRNVMMLAGTPPIQGILDARDASNSDPVAKVKEAIWKDRLAQIFLSLAQSNPDLLQIRLIDQNGMELIRVNSTRGKATRVKAPQLQDKSSRPYFIRTLADPENRVHYYGIDLNRENDKIETPYAAVLRAATKVYGHDNQLLGLIVINVDMTHAIARLEKVVENGKIFVMTNDKGVLLAHPDKTKTFGADLKTPFRLQTEYPELAPFLEGEVSREGESYIVHNDQYIARVAKVSLSDDAESHPILIATVTPMELVLAQSRSMRDQIILITLLLVLAGALVASILTRYLVRPLQLLTKATHELSMGASIDHLKVQGENRNDEIGILLRSVYDMASRLEEKQERIRAILATAENPILTINQRGIIKDINQGTCNLFGYSRGEMLGKNISMLMNPYDKDRHDSYLRHYAAGGKPNIIGVGREVVAIRKDHTPVHIHLAVSHMRVKDEIYYTGIMTDLTELKKVDRLKSEFVSKVSHELRTPLTSIKGSLGLLRTLMPAELPMQSRKMLDIAYGNCDRLAKLVNDILDIEKIEAGQLSFDFQSVNVRELVEQTIESNRGFAQEYKVSLQLDCADDDMTIHADPDRLEQVLTNLISNAVKYSPDNGYVLISAKRENEKVRLSVTDYGAGIPESFRERVFIKFAQADNSGACKAGGSGLGLAISQEIVRAHSGHISFETETGVGTTFHVELDLMEEAAPTLDGNHDLSPTTSSHQAGSGEPEEVPVPLKDIA